MRLSTLIRISSPVFYNTLLIAFDATGRGACSAI